MSEALLSRQGARPEPLPHAVEFDHLQRWLLRLGVSLTDAGPLAKWRYLARSRYKVGMSWFMRDLDAVRRLAERLPHMPRAGAFE